MNEIVVIAIPNDFDRQACRDLLHPSRNFLPSTNYASIQRLSTQIDRSTQNSAGGLYFLPLCRFPSVPLVSPPLASPLLATVGFLVFGFLRWCSGIHSSSYLAPLEVTVTVLTGALALGRTRLDFLAFAAGK